MTNFAIVEVEDGLTVVELRRRQSPEDAALYQGGTLVDPGPYLSYDDACDALNELQYEDEDEEE